MTRGYLVDLMEIAYRTNGMSAALAIAEAEAARERKQALRALAPRFTMLALGAATFNAWFVGVDFDWPELAIMTVCFTCMVYLVARFRPEWIDS